MKRIEPETLILYGVTIVGLVMTFKFYGELLSDLITGALARLP